VGRRIRVLHILWSGRIGGTEEYIFNLVKRLDPGKYEITLCFLKERGELFEEVCRFGKFRVDFIGIKSGYDILGVFRFGLYLIRNRFHIIHSHMRNILSTFILFICTTKIPKVLTHHLSPGDLDSITIRKNRLYYRLFSNVFNYIIAISGNVKYSIINVLGYPSPERILIVYNGVDITRFKPDKTYPAELDYLGRSGGRIVGFIGRMVHFKRPILFVRTAIEILKKGRDYHFVMVGDGSELEKCREKVMRDGLKDYFTFLGYRRDIPQILKSFDALLFTSEGEGFGIVIIEAMAMGVPVFAVNDGAVPEIIRDRENGILLNTTDPVVMANEIIEVLNDTLLINKIKLNAINDVRNKFSIEVSVRKTDEIYNKLLNVYQHG